MKTMRVSPHTIRWRCATCHHSGIVPLLTGATQRDVEAAIVRGHHRRSTACHVHHGVNHVQATQNGTPWPPALNPVEPLTLVGRSRRDET